MEFVLKTKCIKLIQSKFKPIHLLEIVFLVQTLINKHHFVMLTIFHLHRVLRQTDGGRSKGQIHILYKLTWICR